MDRSRIVRAQDEVERIGRDAIEAALLAAGFQALANPTAPLDRLALERAYEDIYRAAVFGVGGVIAEEIDLLLKEQDEPFFFRFFREFMAAFGGARITRVLDTTRRQISEMVLRGQIEGKPLNVVRDEITEAWPVIARTRATTIARTEAHMAGQSASIGVARRARMPLLKQWNSVEDQRTRDFGEGDGDVDEFSHRVMDGVTVAIDQPFMVPTWTGAMEPLMHPGDPNGSPGNIINCRCVQTYKRAEQ